MPDALSEATDQSLIPPTYEPSPEPVIDPITRSPLHAGVGIGRYYGLHITAAIFPATAGLILYGWRAVAAIATVVCSALLGALVWRTIGSRGGQIRLIHIGWYALLLALMLPPHLAARFDAGGRGAPWPSLVAAGLTLVILIWTLGGLGAGRIHPVLVGYLLFYVLYGSALVPHRVLQRDNLVTGDIFDAPKPDLVPSAEPWISAASPGGGEAIWRENTADILSNFTTGTESIDPRMRIKLDVLLRDRMPPLEDLIVGGDPGPVGSGCALGVIVGGLFLLYRGLIDFRIPLLIIIFAYLSMLILPVPVIVRDQFQYRWLALRVEGMSWQTILTFVHYELLAGPMLFMALFLATTPSIRPINKSARAVYAGLTGILTAVFQLYTSVAWGPYLALLIASLLTPTFDKVLRPKPLV